MSGTEAVGTYLKVIREREGLTASDVVARIVRMAPNLKPVPTTGVISKIERGVTKTPGIRLVALINRALRGNPAHIQLLAFNDQVPKESGEKLANEWLALTPAERDQIINLIENVGPGVVVAAARALLNQP